MIVDALSLWLRRPLRRQCVNNYLKKLFGKGTLDHFIE